MAMALQLSIRIWAESEGSYGTYHIASFRGDSGLTMLLAGRITCLRPDLHYTNKASSKCITSNDDTTLDSSTRIYIAPNADDLPTWVATMQHIAKEGRCFVISVNQFCRVTQPFLGIFTFFAVIETKSYVQVSDFPKDYPPFTADHYDRKPDGSRWAPDDVLSRGGSCVVGPLGNFITEPMWDKEAIVYADLELTKLAEARVSIRQWTLDLLLTIFSLISMSSGAIHVPTFCKCW